MITSEKPLSKMKYTDVNYNCVKRLTESGFKQLFYCPSKTMVADMLTKQLPKTDFQRHRDVLMRLQSEV